MATAIINQQLESLEPCLSTNWQKPQSALPHLPAELLFLIIDQVDIPTASHLGLSCRSLHDTVSFVLDDIVKQTEQAMLKEMCGNHRAIWRWMKDSRVWLGDIACVKAFLSDFDEFDLLGWG